MSLEDQLRDVLGEEAGQRSTSRPDVVGLISGGRARRRRRDATRGVLVAAAIVLVGGTAYGIAQIGTDRVDSAPDSAATTFNVPVPTSAAQSGGRARIAPGTYEVFVGRDFTGARIDADVTVDGSGWTSGDNLVVYGLPYTAGVGIYRPLLVAAEPSTGCMGDWQASPPAASPRALARQLARLPRSSVVQPPTPTRALGRDAFHLTMRIDNSCPADEYYQVAEAITGERGLTFSHVTTDVIIDFWVVELDRTMVVVDRWNDVGADQELIDQTARARESITIAPTG